MIIIQIQFLRAAFGVTVITSERLSVKQARVQIDDIKFGDRLRFQLFMNLLNIIQRIRF